MVQRTENPSQAVLVIGKLLLRLLQRRPDPGLIQHCWDFVFSQHVCISSFFPLHCCLSGDALHVSLQQTQPVAFSIGISIKGPSLIFIDHRESIHLHPIYSNGPFKALPSLCLGHVPVSEERSQVPKGQAA